MGSAPICDFVNMIQYVELKEFTRAALFCDDAMLFSYDLKPHAVEPFSALTHEVCRQNPSSSNQEKAEKLFSLLNTDWLDPERNTFIRQKQVAQLYISYFSSALPSSVSVSKDDFEKKVQMYADTTVCEETVLADLAEGLKFLDQKGVTVSLNEIGTHFFTLSAQDYQRILSVAKKRYGFTTGGCVDLDDFLQRAMFVYFERLSDDIDALAREAYLCVDHTEFMEFVFSLDTESNGKSLRRRYTDSGYYAQFKGSIQRPSLEVSVLSMISAFHGLRTDDGKEYQHVISYCGESFWRTAWGELARYHEERLLEKEHKQYTSKCSDRYACTISEISKNLAAKHGIELSDSSVGLIAKKALQKIRLELEKRGIEYHDALGSYMHENSLSV